MDLKWPKYIQPSDFLDARSLFFIPKELYPIILKKLNVLNNSKVLDVGCGIGFLTKIFLGSNINLYVTGVDAEEEFIYEAKRRFKGKEEFAKFLVADATNLPFQESSFDIVVSNTFFNCVRKPKLAINEMKRVCKNGGTIGSITSMLMTPFYYHGKYPDSCVWYDDLRIIDAKISELYGKLMGNVNKGLKTSYVPYFFSKHGLTNISIFPVGMSFSLSDSNVSKKDKILYIEKLYSSEVIRFENCLEIDFFRRSISEKEKKEYLKLLLAKKIFC